LPVHNRGRVTENFCKQLINQSYEDYHLILVDDGSTDNTVAIVKNIIIPNKLTVLRGDGNLWWAGSLQIAKQWAEQNLSSVDLILIINDDVLMSSTYLENGAIEFYKEKNTSNNILLFTPSRFKSNGELVGGGYYYDLKKFKFIPSLQSSEVNCIPTRGLFLTVKDFQIIGDFVPKLLPHYYSDLEYTYRAFNKGYELKISRDTTLVMDENLTGIHGREIFKSSSNKFFSNLFSKRYAMNPIYCKNFVFCTTQNPFLRLILLVKIFINFSITVVKFVKIKLVSKLKKTW
jgi:GT2 family glycosyltransferase